MTSFTNALVFTGTSEQDFAEAFTAQDGRFTWVGASIQTLRTHPNLGQGPDAWIEDFGYNEADYPDGTPTRHDLDQVSTTPPVHCLRADVHTGVVNSYLLDLAGITADTPDPEASRFERFADGTPNGVLEEFGAIEAVTRFRPVPDTGEWTRRIVALGERYGRLGLTTVDDLLASHTPDSLATFRRAAAAGFPQRVGLFWRWDPADPLPELSEDDRTGDIRVAGVKVITDGAYANRTAWTSTPTPAPATTAIPPRPSRTCWRPSRGRAATAPRPRSTRWAMRQSASSSTPSPTPSRGWASARRSASSTARWSPRR